MRLSDFDYDLPERLIALRPVRPRPAARLLVSGDGPLRDTHVRHLPSVLRPGDLLIFNDTKVLPARLSGVRRRETPHGSGVARIDLTLTEPGTDGSWTALARPAKRLQAGDVIRFSESLSASVQGPPFEGAVHLSFDTGGEDFETSLSRHGAMPLPPYIAGKRPPDAADMEDYQSVFACQPGAVAAPTASLHFDEDLLARLAAAGIEAAHVTLHVGAGTFLPIKSEDVSGHRMHAERGDVTEAAASAIMDAKRQGRRVIPVGTTALRLIESAATGTGEMGAWHGETDIFIRPGFEFRIADGLMTNFHLPKSTLLMLVAGLIGMERMRALYARAVAEEYRFFSYGDACLLFPDRSRTAGKG